MDLQDLSGQNAAPIPAAREREDRGAAGATDSNTAPANPIFKKLNNGVDSLYVAYEGEIPDEIEGVLENLKAKAQSKNPMVVAEAQLTAGDHIFEVSDRAGGGFTFALVDGAFNIKISRNNSPMPMAYVQISSKFLHRVGPVTALKELDFVIGHLSNNGNAKPSRIDIFADIVTNERLGRFRSENFITDCLDFVFYESKPTLTGINVGMGGDISLRIYDKTRQLEKVDRPDVKEQWLQSGWDGLGRVWRVEFQVRRDGLKSLGLNEIHEALEKLPELWSFLTTDFVRLVEINESDRSHSERWKLTAVWAEIQKCFGELREYSLKRDTLFLRPPSEEHMYKNALSGITSIMALENIEDAEAAVGVWLDRLESYHRKHGSGHEGGKDYAAKKARLKRRKFSSFLNKPRAGDD